jgi:hypothetical protein
VRVPDPVVFFQNLRHDTETMIGEGAHSSDVERMRSRRLKRFWSEVEYYERATGRTLYFSPSLEVPE